MRKIDIIIPIYNGLDDLKKCMESIRKHTDLKEHRVILVNDKSPDIRVAQFLETQKGENIVIIDSQVNEGFSASVNKGMQYSDRDVILLNSDTIVTKGWIEKIVRCAYSSDSIGTVTPMSNSATLCSVPIMCQDNQIPQGRSIEQYAEIVEKCSLRKYPEITVAVGFCMYIKRNVIDEVGLFDGETFERGYGEENDFCNRAGLLGYKHVMCDDTLIYHKGTVSFVTDEKQKLIEKHTKYLEEWYPYQMRKNHLYCMINPDQYLRDNISIWNAVNNGKKNILFVIQSDFREDASDNVGGTQFHVKDLVENSKEEYNVFVVARDQDMLRLTIYIQEERISFKFYIGNKDEHPAIYDLRIKDVLNKIMQAFSIALIHVHHIYGLSFDVFEIANKLNIPYFMTVHDYYYICPVIKLMNHQNSVCSKQAESELCKTCLEQKCGISSRVDFITQWRSKVQEALNGAQKVIFPSEETKRIFEIYFKDGQNKYQVIYHGLDTNPFDKISITQEIKNGQIFSCIDSVFEERFVIKGWAFLENMDCAVTTVILKITDSTGKIAFVPSEKVKRGDVSNQFGNEKYVWSGFKANVLGYGLNPGKIDIQIIIQTKEQYYIEDGHKSGTVSEKKINNDNINIAFIGGLVPEKGSQLAYELIRKSSKKINWYIIGAMNDPDLERLEQDNLLKYGPYQREETERIMNEYDIDLVCILPTWPETFCYTLSEAWLAKIPVIGTAIGALKERFVDGKGGWLFELDKDIIENISCLLNEIVDRKEEIQKKKESIEEVPLKTVAEMGKEYNALYEQFALDDVTVNYLYKEEMLQGFRLEQKHLYGDLDIAFNNILTENRNEIQNTYNIQVEYWKKQCEEYEKNYGNSMRRLDKLRKSKIYKIWKKFS